MKPPLSHDLTCWNCGHVAPALTRVGTADGDAYWCGNCADAGRTPSRWKLHAACVFAALAVLVLVVGLAGCCADCGVGR